MHILEASPSLQRLSLAVDGPGAGRALAPLHPPFVQVPNTQPLLATTAILARLQDLRFDFLSDEAVPLLSALDERSLCLRKVMVGGSKRQLQDPEAALLALLRCLGDGLEEFRFHVELEAEMRPFLRDFLRTRLGATENQFRNRASLVSLVSNWPAFDDDGIRCIADNCPRLQTLLLDRCEYWTDAAVSTLAENLTELRHLRLRPSTMLSDRSLFALTEVSERFARLEIEPSYSMSSQMLDHLRQRLSPGAESLAGAMAGFNPLAMMGAVVGEVPPAQQAGAAPPAQQAGTAQGGQAPQVQRVGAAQLEERCLVILKGEDEEAEAVDSLKRCTVPHMDDIGW